MKNTDHLNDLFYKPYFKAKDGGHGGTSCKTGAKGNNYILKVPAGTVIYKILVDDPQAYKVKNKISDEVENGNLEKLIDLNENNTELVLAKGGKGGKGNFRFRSATNRTPEQFTEGTNGESEHFYLELRKIADIGLVGFPNAGKSSLLAHLSNSKPKIASYPFTTLEPKIGVIREIGNNHIEKIITIADIPGIIKDAHKNKGLGHQFLRHILRCKVLLFMVDTAGVDMREPYDDIANLRKEINLYDKALAEKKWIIVANKIDLPESEEKLEILKDKFAKIKIVPISIIENVNMEKLKESLFDLV